MQLVAMWSTGSVLASSPRPPPWSLRSLSAQWSECCQPPPFSSTCPLACYPASALPCGPNTQLHGTISSVTVKRAASIDWSPGSSRPSVFHFCPHLTLSSRFQRRQGSRGPTSAFLPLMVGCPQLGQLGASTLGFWGNSWRRDSCLWTSSKPTLLSWWLEGSTRCVCVCVICVIVGSPHSISPLIPSSLQTAVPLQFAFFELGRNPEVQETVRQQVRESWAKAGGDLQKALHGAPLLKGTVKEVLRYLNTLFYLHMICSTWGFLFIASLQHIIRMLVGAFESEQYLHYSPRNWTVVTPETETLTVYFIFYQLPWRQTSLHLRCLNV